MCAVHKPVFDPLIPSYRLGYLVPWITGINISAEPEPTFPLWEFSFSRSGVEEACLPPKDPRLILQLQERSLQSVSGLSSLTMISATEDEPLHGKSKQSTIKSLDSGTDKNVLLV